VCRPFCFLVIAHACACPALYCVIYAQGIIVDNFNETKASFMSASPLVFIHSLLVSICDLACGRLLCLTSVELAAGITFTPDLIIAHLPVTSVIAQTHEQRRWAAFQEEVLHVPVPLKFPVPENRWRRAVFSIVTRKL
jgi:hypothetical protein